VLPCRLKDVTMGVFQQRPRASCIADLRRAPDVFVVEPCMPHHHGLTVHCPFVFGGFGFPRLKGRARGARVPCFLFI
jgi:hypothetical protein